MIYKKLIYLNKKITATVMAQSQLYRGGFVLFCGWYK